MPGNSFGKIFKFNTWGESHGPAIGCTIDGVPSKINIKWKIGTIHSSTFLLKIVMIYDVSIYIKLYDVR